MCVCVCVCVCVCECVCVCVSVCVLFLVVVFFVAVVVTVLLFRLNCPTLQQQSLMFNRLVYEQVYWQVEKTGQSM